MDKEDKRELNPNEVKDRKEKYLDLLEELEEKNKLGVRTNVNPDQQLDNDDILRQR